MQFDCANICIAEKRDKGVIYAECTSLAYAFGLQLIVCITFDLNNSADFWRFDFVRLFA